MGKNHTPLQREKARQSLIEFHRKMRPFMQMCGAQCRGQPGKFCARIPVKGRERCEIHGGRTPRGKEWHRQQRPDGSRKSDEWRVVNKQKTAKIRRKDLAERLAAMTSDERQAYEKRSLAVRPGTLADRAGRQRNQKLKKEWANLTEKDPPMSPEAQAIQVEIDRLNDLLKSRTDLASAPGTTETVPSVTPTTRSHDRWMKWKSNET